MNVYTEFIFVSLDRPHISMVVQRAILQSEHRAPTFSSHHRNASIQYVGLPSSLFPVACTTSTEGLLFTLCNGRDIAEAANRRVRARARHMGFVVDRVAGTIGQPVPDIPNGLSLTPTQKT